MSRYVGRVYILPVPKLSKPSDGDVMSYMLTGRLDGRNPQGTKSEEIADQRSQAIEMYRVKICRTWGRADRSSTPPGLNTAGPTLAAPA